MATRAAPFLWRDTMKAGARRSGAMIGALALLVALVLLALALGSYHPGDPSLNTAAGGPVRNLIGAPGAMIADLMLALAGPPVALMLPPVLLIALRLWRGRPVGRWVAMLRNCAIAVALMATALAFISSASVLWLPAGYGGIVGLTIADLCKWAIHLIGNETAEIWTMRLVGTLFGIAGVVIWARAVNLELPERRLALPSFRRDAPADEAPAERVIAEPTPKPQPRKPAAPIDKPAPVIADRTLAPSLAKPKAEQGSLDFRDNYRLPPLDLLKPAPAGTKAAVDKAALERNARLLESVLDDFNVKGSIVEVRPGPVVTMYELEPAAGIKASRVIQLADDIARNMSAISARVATIPGRSVIGIELPNAKREAVNLHELIGSQSFADQSGGLPLVLGKNIAGDPVVADLAPMPHLLVAGTTGSGKSVGLNCMILSLLYRLTPDQCRLIMIDPKMLELSIYKGIPHLLADVVTDPPKAVRALKWAVEQMEERYRMMASVNVRGLASFNEKVKAAKAKGQKLGRRVQVGYDPDTGKPMYEEEELDLVPLPQIVVIVDELADLMMTAGKEVEFLIQRLAQKARAAGIHLIMATQRPSVDVITGVIKANLPTRISFHVTSKIDSRTILGEQGAEQLLGKGDMLYMPGGKGVARVHGPFVSDEEVQAVADFWRSQGEPDYIDAVTNDPEGDDGFAMEGGPSGDDSPEDQLYRRACQLVAESQKASTSWLQRQLRVGYNSAARLIERMEKDGLVSRPDHVGRREVLMDPDGRPLA
ncbi:DNA translocase FtsK 4TM domain-containing protein [Sphingomonas cannabina]|uniref:FtsK/SpoIIIE family DNA translocase n=1 Tax=Sphingomonas cannabina TaxID=2899123 RepID=UPI001F37C2A9|nr:DNA translocase FtsK 4TM domain-containing protein [Sphingomonas cannabina]UIJ45892.1 DNA translocase FtsK 4TM domain-containing protein [Sphingomonas cannabina]